jgi:1-deoxy-D-xylulose-5-phosphate synthase
MIDMMNRDEKVTTVTAGMPDGTGLNKVIPEFPERAFDVGIAESHATDMCAGMAKSGLRPFASIYSTFLQRAFDQVFQEVSLQGLPVRFCMDRAGLVGGDGAVHHGFLDIGYLRGFPGMTLLAPMDEPTLKRCLEFMREWDEGPIACRYPRGQVPEEPHEEEPPAFELGKAHQLVEGSDLAIVAYGAIAYEALEAQKRLAEQGYSIAVYDARFAKPVDSELFRSLIEAGTPIVTVEDHARIGGFGTCVVEACNEMGLSTAGITRLGLPDHWIYQGSRGGQLAEAGIDADSIARTVRHALDTGAPVERSAVEGSTDPTEPVK